MPQANSHPLLLVLTTMWLAACSLPTHPGPQGQTSAPLPRNAPMPGSDIDIGQPEDAETDSASGGGGGSSSGPLPGSGPPTSPGQGGSAQQSPEDSADRPTQTESAGQSETVAEGAPGGASGEAGASGDPAAATGEVGADDSAGSPESDGAGRAVTQEGGGSGGAEALDRPPEDSNGPMGDESGSDSEQLQAGDGSGDDGSGSDSFPGVPGGSGSHAEQDQQQRVAGQAISDVDPLPDAGESGEVSGWGEGGSAEGGTSGDIAAATGDGGADDGAGSPEGVGAGPAETPDDGSRGPEAPESTLEDPRGLMAGESGSDSEGVQPAGSGSGGNGGAGPAGDSHPGGPANSGSAGSQGQDVAAERSAHQGSGDQGVLQNSSQSTGETGGSGAQAASGEARHGSGTGGIAGPPEQRGSQSGAGERAQSDDIDLRTAGTEEGFGSGGLEDTGDDLSRASRGSSGAEQHSGGALESLEGVIDSQPSAEGARTAAGSDGEAFGGGAQWPSSDEGTASHAGPGGSGEREFERSLERTDDIILSEREAIAASGRGGPAADDTFGQSIGGRAADPGPDGMAGGGQGRGGVAAIDIDEDDALAAARFAGCDDEDRVARQLCEAAIKEDDPFLRAALWEEYNAYRRVLAR